MQTAAETRSGLMLRIRCIWYQINVHAWYGRCSFQGCDGLEPCHLSILYRYVHNWHLLFAVRARPNLIRSQWIGHRRTSLTNSHPCFSYRSCSMLFFRSGNPRHQVHQHFKACSEFMSAVTHARAAVTGNCLFCHSFWIFCRPPTQSLILIRYTNATTRRWRLYLSMDNMRMLLDQHSAIAFDVADPWPVQCACRQILGQATMYELRH